MVGIQKSRVNHSKWIWDDTESHVEASISVGREACDVRTAMVEGRVRLEVASADSKMSKLEQEEAEVSDVGAVGKGDTEHHASVLAAVVRSHLPRLTGELEVVRSCVGSELLKSIDLCQLSVDLEKITEDKLVLHLSVISVVIGRARNGVWLPGSRRLRAGNTVKLAVGTRAQRALMLTRRFGVRTKRLVICSRAGSMSLVAEGRLKATL
jgi:hypothetical protein